jgi:hypothetical protein
MANELADRAADASVITSELAMLRAVPLPPCH